MFFLPNAQSSIDFHFGFRCNTSFSYSILVALNPYIRGHMISTQVYFLPTKEYHGSIVNDRLTTINSYKTNCS